MQMSHNSIANIVNNAPIAKLDNPQPGFFCISTAASPAIAENPAPMTTT
jgi:hypothetical protein